eukprot:TRINITY_DN376_c0_g1_i9.p1 TRINITY_DN376_c0_g1~~TRINITY_DN376_c0_g1_i9.p1  ORF type:complete len:168 (-),score=21.23 TRINITY_DN376_c0_g1_i9:415-918(-)
MMITTGRTHTPNTPARWAIMPIPSKGTTSTMTIMGRTGVMMTTWPSLVKYDSDHAGMTGYAKPAEGKSTKYNDDYDGKDAYPEYTSKVGDYAYTKKRNDKYTDNSGEGRSDDDDLAKSRDYLAKSRDYYQDVKYDSDHAGMTGYAKPAEGKSTKYNDDCRGQEHQVQ